ncbi:hypothetical protein EKK58_00895 [Candidatus Dependentiae bacterium]|nr:MAG: hypothetical protein EKK58_00895 [Candidatus Dependentiae bacterium]
MGITQIRFALLHFPIQLWDRKGFKAIGGTDGEGADMDAMWLLREMDVHELNGLGVFVPGHMVGSQEVKAVGDDDVAVTQELSSGGLWHLLTCQGVLRIPLRGFPCPEQPPRSGFDQIRPIGIDDLQHPTIGMQGRKTLKRGMYLLYYRGRGGDRGIGHLKLNLRR